MADYTAIPADMHFIEELAVFCQGEGKGKSIDLGGRHLRAKGGYSKEFGYSWHEHPRPHWYLPFLSEGTKIRNGQISLSPRVMLVNSGKGLALEDVRLHGLGNPKEDERNAFLVTGAASHIALTNVVADAVGFYFWEGAGAALSQCSFQSGLHGVSVWGRSHITAVDCKVSGSQNSGFCFTEGAHVELVRCTSEGSVSGSGVWCGEACNISAKECTLTNNAQFGVESNHAKSELTVHACVMTNNLAGEKDHWDGGVVKEV